MVGVNSYENQYQKNNKRDIAYVSYGRKDIPESLETDRNQDDGHIEHNKAKAKRIEIKKQVGSNEEPSKSRFPGWVIGLIAFFAILLLCAGLFLVFGRNSDKVYTN